MIKKQHAVTIKQHIAVPTAWYSCFLMPSLTDKEPHKDVATAGNPKMAKPARVIKK